MLKTTSDNGFDYYLCRVDLKEKTTNYYFEINRGIGIYLFQTRCIKRSPSYGKFTVIPHFYMQIWIKGSVMYQIYVDRFCDGDKTNNVKTGEYVYLGRQVVFKDDSYEYPLPRIFGIFTEEI